MKSWGITTQVIVTFNVVNIQHAYIVMCELQELLEDNEYYEDAMMSVTDRHHDHDEGRCPVCLCPQSQHTYRALNKTYCLYHQKICETLTNTDKTS